MSNFRTKLFGLAGVAMTFSGLAYGQITCTYTTPTATLIRAEGLTEQLPSVVINCPANAGAITVTLQDFVSLPVTSKILNPTANVSEAIVVGSAPLVAAGQLGVVSGNTITWTFTIPPGGASTVTVSNVRVNASSGAASTGAPTAVTESFFIQGPAVSINSGPILGGVGTTSAITTAYIENGLAVSKSFTGTGTGLIPGPPQVFTPGTTAGASNFVVCTALTPGTGVVNGLNSIISVIQVAENFTYALKDNALAATIQESEQPAVAIPVGTVFAVAGTTTTVSNAASSATRIILTFANVPTGLTIYVPTTVTSSAVGGLSVTLTGSASGSYSSVTAVTPSSANGLIVAGTSFSVPVAPVTVSAGTGTAVYEVATPESAGVPPTAINLLDTLNIPVFAQATANTITASATAMTVTVGLGPTGATSNIPDFNASAATNVTLNSSAFAICQTSLLFPFVTNQVGFDTGISIANTSTDPFTFRPLTTPQTGTCTLNFYGNGAPTPSSVTGPTVNSGASYTFQLSSVAPGFQGYLIAQCNFQYGHAFAFATNGATAGNASTAFSYLAGVIPNGLGTTRGAGAGEALGF
jgi:hypothetical protein